MKAFYASCLVVAVTVSVSWADDNGSRIFDLPQGVTISVPDGWVLMGEGQLRAYERARDAIVGDTANATGSDAHVPFQANKRIGGTSIMAMMTIMPGEATQAEILQWADEDGRIAELGRLLGAAQVQGIEAAGVSDAEVGPASLVQVGDKTALHFSITFTAPNGQPFIGDKYFIYTQARTVVFSFQTSGDGYADSSADRRLMLDGLTVR